MTREEVMTESVKVHVAKRKYSHDVWVDRQTKYQQIKERDCYGYKSAKIQNVGGIGKRSIKAR